MKPTLYLFLLTSALLSCKNPAEKIATHPEKTEATADAIKMHTLDKLFVTGDFDGDGKLDSIFQHNYSRLNNTEIENSPDPFQNEWDSVIEWFYRQDALVYLIMNKNTQDTLRLGVAQGLYCLINVGDNNADGKDEIAFVINYLDISRVNSCNIYSLCNGKWTLLKEFAIHEDSFDFETNKAPVFDCIKEHLEKKNGKWMYKDYLNDVAETAEEVGELLPLKMDQCK